MLTSKEACDRALKSGRVTQTARDYREAVCMSSAYRHYIKYHELDLRVNRLENHVVIWRQE